MKSSQFLALILESVRMGMGGGYQRENDLIDRTTLVVKSLATNPDPDEKIKENIGLTIKFLHKRKYWVKSKKGWLGRPDSIFEYVEPIIVEKVVQKEDNKGGRMTKGKKHGRSRR